MEQQEQIRASPVEREPSELPRDEKHLWMMLRKTMKEMIKAIEREHGIDDTHKQS